VDGTERNPLYGGGPRGEARTRCPAKNLTEPQNSQGGEPDHATTAPTVKGGRDSVTRENPQAKTHDLVIQRILRHSNVAVTQTHYIKTSSEDSREAMALLGEAVERGSSGPQSARNRTFDAEPKSVN
jgi:hypothetical protein